ncbi:MAG: SDR family oxidoreductase [Nostocoides sp.]
MTTEQPDTATSGAPVAVVTGASRGIGAHVADALSSAGYQVERGSSRTAAVQDPRAVAAWVGDIHRRRGRIDVLINNAGVIDTEVGILDSDPDQWWHTQEVNIRGAYLMAWHVGQLMRADGGGRIVNLNSGAATRPGDVASGYNVSKTALARITGSLDLAGRDCGIRALDLMPGVVRTDMTGAMESHTDRTEWTDPQDVADLVLAFAAGELDEWSGRLVRAGVDTVASLRERAQAGLAPADRTITVQRWGRDDPLP